MSDEHLTFKSATVKLTLACEIDIFTVKDVPENFL